MNTRAAAVTATSLVGLIALFVSATGPLRGSFGDALVIVMGVAALATAGVGTARTRVLGALGLGCGLEALQTLHLVGPDSHWLAHLILGSTFDPLDLAMYVAGAAAAAALERWWTRPAQARPESPSQRVYSASISAGSASPRAVSAATSSRRSR